MGGYRKPVLELVEAFRKETGLEAQAAFGHIKQIETQARQNPEVAFLIGDKNLLEPTGLFSRFDRLGMGRLVLVAAKGKSLTGPEDLKGQAFGRIALAIADRAGPSLEMPQTCYDPIEISLGTVKERTLTAAQSRFQAFLQGDAARRIMAANGL